MQTSAERIETFRCGQVIMFWPQRNVSQNGSHNKAVDRCLTEVAMTPSPDLLSPAAGASAGMLATGRD